MYTRITFKKLEKKTPLRIIKKTMNFTTKLVNRISELSTQTKG
jgi:hypothetical protein